jgi:tetratricopeptide (TPR) repeat protein
MLKGDYELAIEDFNRSLEKNPYKTNVYQLRGIAYFNTGQLERARLDFLKVLKDQPYNKYAQDYLSQVEEVLNQERNASNEQQMAEARKIAMARQKRAEEREKMIWGVVVPMAVWTAIAWSWYQ